jgi:endoglucanase
MKYVAILTVLTVALVAACDSSSAILPDVNVEVTGAINSLVGARLFVDPDSPAREQAERWRASRPNDAAMMDRIASQPVAQWIGDWNDDVRGDVAEGVAGATGSGALPVFVAYNIPNRDCGSYSAGGSANASGYRQWIREFAAGLGGTRSVVILEPDATPDAECLSSNAREERFGLLRDAVQVLKAANALVYIDGGNALWMTPSEIAALLVAAGIEKADGFSLNVSNFLVTSVSLSYGESVSRLVGGKHFIIDVSRNGAGAAANGDWCNPSGRALGAAPTTHTGHPLADAFLWIKYPGESDGTCNGGPKAGEWWAEYALGLAQRQSAAAAMSN